MTDRVAAEVVLRSPAGTSVVDGGAVDAESVGRHLPDAGTIAAASRRLSGLGFQIGQKGPVTIAITGDGALFERTFGTSGPPGEPRVPDELADLVVAVTFPERPQLHV
jgi:hypothetical protein